jgi:hypothetical protein
MIFKTELKLDQTQLAEIIALYVDKCFPLHCKVTKERVRFEVNTGFTSPRGRRPVSFSGATVELVMDVPVKENNKIIGVN